MQVSKKGINNRIEKKIFRCLFQVLADLKSPKQVDSFLSDVLSKTEKTVLAKRLGIVYYLNKNKSYEAIRKDLKVSSATIANVQKWMEEGGEGLNLALKAIEADEWADEIIGKIGDGFKRMFKKD